MKRSNILILSLLFGFFITNFALADPPDNTLLKYHSAYLSINLNHALESSKIIYNLTKEPSFDKKHLENDLNRIKQDIDDANINVANILINTLAEKKKSIDKYLKNIDEHLAQASLDLKAISEKLQKQQDFAPLISDIYHQINKAENEDHREIKRILKLKSFNEPVLIKVKPE